MKNWSVEPLEPFGMIVRPSRKGKGIVESDIEDILDLISKHRVVVFREFALLEGEEFPTFCRKFGEALEWDFGTVNTLKSSPDAKNYLYTNGAVPFHWDGAFVGQVPRFIFFHCDAAPEPDSGGETLFTDTTLMLDRAGSKTKERWRRVNITYSTEKIVHYGGTFTSPIICNYPSAKSDVIRFAEPVTDLNPVSIEIDGIDSSEHDAFLDDMHIRLNDESCCYAHQWHHGDLVVADNLVLLHGRRAFDNDTSRLIRRVNIL